MDKVPKGFRFHPTDQELIAYYLNLKNKGIDGAADVLKVVREYNPYGDTEPCKIIKDLGGDNLCDEDLYFFMKQKFNQERSQIDRRIGKGKWIKGRGQSTIYIGQKEIGFKNVLKYKTKSSGQPPKNDCWYMDEYSSKDTGYGYVICRFRKKIEKDDKSRGNTNFLTMSVPTSIDYAGPIPVGFRFRPTDEEIIRYLTGNEIREKGGGRGLALSKAVVTDEDLDIQLSLKPITAGETIKPAEDNRKSNGLSNVETEAVAPVMQEPSLQLMEYMKDNPFLHAFDLYGKTEPWDIWSEFGGDELCYQDLFFFTQWKAHLEGERIARKVGSLGGRWHGDEPRKTINDRNGKLIGHKQKFKYKRTDYSPDAEWYLHDYSLPEARVGDYIICRLRKIEKLASDVSSPNEDSSNKKMKNDPETSTLATTDGSNQGQAATAEESKQEDDSSEAKPKRDNELTEVNEAGNRTLRLFGVDLRSSIREKE